MKPVEIRGDSQFFATPIATVASSFPTSSSTFPHTLERIIPAQRKVCMNNAPPTVLVIGYGNDLRSDDAVGKRVAEAVATWNLPYVRALAVHQLTPELTVRLTDVERVIFVDAYRATPEQEVQVRPLEPVYAGGIAGHTGDPQSLLALTKALYSYCPRAWWVTIPGVNFEVGDSLSFIAERGVAVALKRIDQLIDPPGPPMLGGEATLALPQSMDANAMNGLRPTNSPKEMRHA
jgi:hydrogenase maturation protease